MAFPRGRIGTRELYERAGCSKSLFFRDFRNQPYWQERLDIKETRDGRLHFADGEGVLELAAEIARRRSPIASARRRNLSRPCPACQTLVNVKRKQCPGCGRQIRSDNDPDDRTS